MPKSQKSSASSATRKKHARKAAGGAEQQLPLPKEKKKDKTAKGKNKEPRVKSYIPPSKPAPVRPDPLDSLGIAKQLPPELLVVLRRLGKKDAVTKRKALEDFAAGWINRGYEEVDTLVTALPVWLHHLPSLLLHASRRIRALAANIHGALLCIPTILTNTVFFLRESGESAQVEAVLGSWCIAAEDVERQVAREARRAWDFAFRSGSIELDGTLFGLVLNFVQRALLDPLAVYAELNPVQPAFVPPPVVRGGGKRTPSMPVSPARLPEDDLQTRKPEDDEESEGDRNARIRVGVLGVLRWSLEQQNLPASELLSELFASTVLWSSLYHGPSPPFALSSLGDSQPIVRKAAWGLLLALLKNRKGEIERLLPSLSSAVLRSAWVEPDAIVRASMWEPLLTLLTQFPRAWVFDVSNPSVSRPTETRDDESDSDSDSASDASLGHDVDGGNTVDNSATQAVEDNAYHEFLQFLQLGCYGSPLQGYPTVVVVLSTLPPSILGNEASSWADLLESFWAALDGRALSSLERAASSAAFLGALMECVIFIVKRARASQQSAEEEGAVASAEAEPKSMTVVIEQQVGRVWDELVARRLRVEAEVAGKILSRTLGMLEGMDEALFSAAWAPISSSLLTGVNAPQTASDFTAQIALTRCLHDFGRPNSLSNRSMSRLVLKVAGILIEKSHEGLKNPNGGSSNKVFENLTDVLDKFSSVILVDPTLTSRLDVLLLENLRSILASSPQLFLTYFTHRNDSAVCSSLWCRVLKVLSVDPLLQTQALPDLLSGAEKGSLPSYLKPDDDELDGLAQKLVAEAMSGQDERELSTVRRLLERPEHFLSRRSASGLLHSIVYAFAEKARVLVRNADADSNSVPIASLRAPLALIAATVKARPEVVFSDDIRTFLPDIFVFGHFFTSGHASAEQTDALCSQSKSVWEISVSNFSAEERDELFASVRSVLRELIADVDSKPSPAVVLRAFTEGNLGNSLNVLDELFPSKDELEDMLRGLPSSPLDPVLSIIDPLVPPQSLWEEESPVPLQFDAFGFSEYTRVVNALLSVVAADRYLARENMWLLEHFLVLSIAASDLILVPTAESAYFARDITEDILRDVVGRVQTLTSFLLADVGDDGWHATIVKSSLQGDTVDKSLKSPSVAWFVSALLLKARNDDSVRNSRVLYIIMQHILNGALPADAEQWVVLVRKFERQAPHTSLAIILAVSESGLEPPGLNRYRNELAAGVLGIHAAKANTDGLSMLRRLAITAPDADSDIAFLPQNRAVNFMKVCQTWATSDEDIEEDVESEMTLVFLHLAPILQNVPGAHWELIFDMVENNLENCSFATTSTLPILARTLKLLLTVRELASTNKSLLADWHERELPILTLVRDLVQKSTGRSSASAPRSFCWEMAFSIVQDLPASLIDHNTLQNMVHLLLEPSPEVAKTAYAMLHEAARKRTEYLVVEAGVDTSSDSTRCELPQELLQVLQSALETREDHTEPNDLLGYLLSWMIVFDLFDNASLRVKMGYASQLRELELIGTSFLPNVLELLDVRGGRSRSFPLELWSAEQYYMQLYDPESSLSAKLLASHLFYRALLNVPSLISTWWGDCKDRQLSSAIASFITKHYSPVLIAAELSHVKDPDGAAELAGENWGIKVALGNGEVTASYTVDDQEMEIAVRLPPDYPLHGIEVREVRRLGVDEKKWRGWLLAVQQVVTSQNGRIVDGLSIFKKNVTHHFENQTECAICYSIISVTELSLPKKRCRTCKNRFHAGCLFKWFNTSHTSSCPLCRSDFI